MPAKKQFDAEIKGAMGRVGKGHGFIIRHRTDLPPEGGGRFFREDSYVITASHCLPFLPPCHPMSFSEEGTYRDLLGMVHSVKNCRMG